MVIFYIDGDLAQNDAANATSNFKGTLEASITQGTLK